MLAVFLCKTASITSNPRPWIWAVTCTVFCASRDQRRRIPDNFTAVAAVAEADVTKVSGIQIRQTIAGAISFIYGTMPVAFGLSQVAKFASAVFPIGP